MGRNGACSASKRTKRRPSRAAAQPTRSVGDVSGAKSDRRTTDQRVESTQPQSLVVTYSFDPGEEGEPYFATVRLTGRRAGVGGQPKPSDAFVRDDALISVVPGSGPLSVSSTIEGVAPGEWSVAAELIRPAAKAGSDMSRQRARRLNVEPLRTAKWSWRRWSISPGATTEVVKTRWAVLSPLARRPAVLPGSLPLLVALGGVIAVLLQVAIVGSRGLSVGVALAVSLLASISGLIGAKLWYAVLNPKDPILRPGWAVDGFLVCAPLVAVAALVTSDLSVGSYLDAITPGFFFTVALGRIGCFLTGCCGGRMSSSPLGVWSSDGRIGARRIPTQLLESGVGLLIGLTTLPLALGHLVPVDGAIFVAAFVAYFAARQFLLRARAQPRKYLWQRRGSTEPSSQLVGTA